VVRRVIDEAWSLAAAARGRRRQRAHRAHAVSALLKVREMGKLGRLAMEPGELIYIDVKSSGAFRAALGIA
jgi:hypothetical protein